MIMKCLSCNHLVTDHAYYESIGDRNFEGLHVCKCGCQGFEYRLPIKQSAAPVLGKVILSLGLIIMVCYMALCMTGCTTAQVIPKPHEPYKPTDVKIDYQNIHQTPLAIETMVFTRITEVQTGKKYLVVSNYSGVTMTEIK